jgi:acetolactate synthase-1/2/3 large subunit
MRTIAEKWALPVGVSFRRQMLFDHLHPNYAGDIGIGPNPKLAKAVKEADVVLLIGGRFGEMPSSDYTLLKSPYPDQTLVHVHADASELGRVFRPTFAINASPAAFVEAFAKRGGPKSPGWAGNAEALHKAYLDWSTPPETGPGPVQMGPIMNYLESVLPDDAIMANGAGNYATWLHRFHRFRRFATQAAPTSGSMGYGTPAAVAAKAMFPDREVICLRRRRLLLMNGQEFATAVQYGLPIIVAGHQQRHLRHDPHASGARISRAVYRVRIDRTRTSLRWPAPMAATARRWKRRPTSRRPSSARGPAASRRS